MFLVTQLIVRVTCETAVQLYIQWYTFRRGGRADT